MMTSINWRTPGFVDYDLFRHQTPGDMHCFFHAVAFAYYKPYRTGTIDGKPTTRKEIALKFRHDLITRLSHIDPLTRKTLYETIANGNLAELGKADPTYYSFEAIKDMLLKDVMVGPEIMVVMQHLLQINIIIIREQSHDVSPRLSDILYDKSIVLYYNNKHYETVSRRIGSDGKHITYFHRNDSFIKMLENRQINKTNKQNK